MAASLLEEKICALSDAPIAASSIRIKMGFLRRLFGIIALQFILISAGTLVSTLCPIVRFYISENDWLLFLAFILFFASYFAILLKKNQNIANVLVLFIHIAIQGFTVSVFVACYDVLAVLQAILLITCAIVLLFLYTLQSSRDYDLLWIVFFISCFCVFPVASSLQAIFFSTREELFLSIAIYIVVLSYQVYTIKILLLKLTPNCYIKAVVLLHTQPVKYFFSKSHFMKDEKTDKSAI